MQPRKIRWIIQVEGDPWQGEGVEEQISSIKGNLKITRNMCLKKLLVSLNAKGFHSFIISINWYYI